MADLLLHFAIGVFVASRFHYERLSRYLLGAVAVLPDLDGLFARLILWRGAEWFGWGPTETQRALVLMGQGGILHSVLAVVFVGLVVTLFSLRWQVGLAAAVAWASHLVLDAFSPEGAMLWWPFSDALVANPLFVPYEPILLILSLFFLVGTLMGDLYLFDVNKDFGERTRLILRKFGPRLAKGAAQMGGFVLLLLLVAKSVLLIGDGLAGGDVIAVGLPEYNVYERTEDGYRIVRWGALGDAVAAETVPRVPAGLQGADVARAETAVCVAEHLRGLGPFYHPVVLGYAEQIVVGEAAAATDLRGPAEGRVLVLVPADGPGFEAAWLASVDATGEADVVLPAQLDVATGCV